MSLSGNTEKINALISAINALPNAGGGGGEASGESLYEIGEVKFSKMQAFASGTTICTVEGLPFTPKHAVFWFDNGSSTATISTSNMRVLTMCQAGYSQVGIAVGKSASNSAEIKYAGTFEMTLTNDGFTIVSRNAYVYVYSSKSYKYIAFG